ncbi:MAG TPA: hypothetical protein VIG51_12000 [Candidatus Baltobacteraceae bacterium]
MMRIHNDGERLVARQTLQEVTRKLEEALALVRRREAARRLECRAIKGVHG